MRVPGVCVLGDQKAGAGVGINSATVRCGEQFREAACIAKIMRNVKGRVSEAWVSGRALLALH